MSQDFKELVINFSRALASDIILANSPVNAKMRQSLLERIRARRNRYDSVYLVLTTNGGNPHDAYMAMRYLHLSYEKISAVILGDCYSAGTLMAIGAHEVIIGDWGHLGPIDIQIRKKDDLWAHSSGMVIHSALKELQAQASQMMSDMMVGLVASSQGGITLKTAMDAATSLTTGLLGELYRQIDPYRIGEDARAMQLMKHYGERLAKLSDNLQPQALVTLLEEYPDHAFIIDRKEAGELFKCARPPSDEERTLFMELEAVSGKQLSEKDRLIFYLNEQESNDDEETRNSNRDNTRGNGAESKTKRTKDGAA